MKYTLFISVVLTISLIKSNCASNCIQEQPLCLTVNLTTLLNVCRSFFRVPCPQTCGVCASETFKLKFLTLINPNFDQKIGVDEAQVFLKSLNISLEDALVTEIKELLLDSKAIINDFYKQIDADENGVASLSELLIGVLNVYEKIGVKIKPEFRESISNIAGIVKLSNNQDILLPKLSELIQIVSEHLDVYPHGLMTLNRVQNMTNGDLNLERVIITQQLGYSVNTKLLASSFLARMDRDNDGYVSQSDFVYSILGYLKFLNMSLLPKVEENLKSYFEIYHSSVQALLNKFEIDDIGLLEGRILPEYENKPFINLVIPIQESIQSVKKFTAVEVMRYIRSASNNVPQRKLTALSIIESAFAVADRNKDGQIDIPEFVYFTVTSLPKEISLYDMNESLKVMKLYDEDNDDKLTSQEFKELLKPNSYLPNSIPLMSFFNPK